MTEPFQDLFEKRIDHIKLDLDRVTKAYAELGRPCATVPTVLVAGTNGKGSTAAFLWKRLTGAGLRTGLFTSPHLHDFAERFQVSLATIDGDRVVEELKSLRKHLSNQTYGGLTFFEVSTLLALSLFREYKTEFNIMEVGMGGRLDATNVCPRMLSIITNIGNDHQEFLGQGLPDIAREKAGIIKRGVPVIWAGRTSTTYRASEGVIEERARALSAPFYSLSRNSTDQYMACHDSFDYSIPIPKPLQSLPGYLKDNYATATLAYHILGEALPALDRNHFDYPTWLKSGTPPPLLGRFQKVVVAGRPLLFDACHNMQGISAFFEALMKEFPGSRKAVLFTGLRDKPIKEMLKRIKRDVDDIFVFAIDDQRSLDLSSIPKGGYPYFTSFSAAWNNIKDQPFDLTIVCGSVRGIGLAQRELGIL